MKRFLVGMICLLGLLSSSLFGAVHETLPTYHWVYDYLDFLQRRGFCTELSMLESPYTRGEVA
ncbi:hypothetical protein KAH55_09310, partial [bacterium]|nr:hypothetical protein [bacterium]